MKAKLRGHHLICLNFFRGEGYSEDLILAQDREDLRLLDFMPGETVDWKLIITIILSIKSFIIYICP